jgi:hypothetical protein
VTYAQLYDIVIRYENLFHVVSRFARDHATLADIWKLDEQLAECKHLPGIREREQGSDERAMGEGGIFRRDMEQRRQNREALAEQQERQRVPRVNVDMPRFLRPPTHVRANHPISDETRTRVELALASDGECRAMIRNDPGAWTQFQRLQQAMQLRTEAAGRGDATSYGQLAAQVHERHNTLLRRLEFLRMAERAFPDIEPAVAEIREVEEVAPTAQETFRGETVPPVAALPPQRAGNVDELAGTSSPGASTGTAAPTPPAPPEGSPAAGSGTAVPRPDPESLIWRTTVPIQAYTWENYIIRPGSVIQENET